jgi:hypothetical protein
MVATIPLWWFSAAVGLAANEKAGTTVRENSKNLTKALKDFVSSRRIEP